MLDTTNIDGEQTVKEKFPFEPGYNPEKLQFFHGIIKCGKPNSITDQWEGVIKYDKVCYKLLNSRNLALRGSILKNTDFLIGIVIYAGLDTKIH